MAQTHQQTHDLTREDIADALSFVNPDDRRDWYRMAMAVWVELGDDGFDVWDKWSQGGGSYSARDARQVWKSARKARNINVGTLIYAAKSNGWKFDSREREPLPAAELEKRKAERAEREKQAIAAAKAAEGAAAKLANEIWNKATPAEGNEHPYLQRKGIHAHGLRIGEWPLFNDDDTVRRWIPGVLLIPMVSRAGKITSLQAVFAETPAGFKSDKSYLRDGKKQGSFHMIGCPKPGAAMFLCEGYATGASIHQATGWAVVVTFDTGNLPKVAEIISEMSPGHSFVVAADNDQWTTSGNIENPGVYWATEAGRVINCRVVVPQFAELTGRPTDFNDLHQREGEAEVCRQLIPALPVAANDSGRVEDSDLLNPNAVDQVDRIGLPDLGGKGAVMPTHRNLLEICRRIGVVLRYNQITKEQELLIPNETFGSDNVATCSYSRLENEAVLFRMPTDKLKNGITYLCDKNQFNPVVAWVQSKPWDKTSRIQAMFDTVTERETMRPDGTKGPRVLAGGKRLRDALMLRWFVSAIAAAFEPHGIEAQGALVLQGDQGKGKTRWLLSLVPRSMGIVKGGVTLNPSDKDSVKQAISNWIVELGELDATFKKTDIANLKSFITRESDTLRLAYAPKESKFARRTVFYGSVNPEGFLHDSTGNRRFWTIPCDIVNQNHGLDMQQVWAEFFELYAAGEQWHLTKEENDALNESNEEFQVTDPIEERIHSRLRWTAEDGDWKWTTATDLLIALGMDRPTSGDATKAGAILRKMPGVQEKRNGKGRWLRVPPVWTIKEDRKRGSDDN